MRYQKEGGMSRLEPADICMAASFTQRFKDIDPLIEQAISRLEADANTSAPLKAVVIEFQNKARKAISQLSGADEQKIRDCVIEVEQAADSAKKAAQADDGISSVSRQAVLEAHGAMCALKSELMELSGS